MLIFNDDQSCLSCNVDMTREIFEKNSYYCCVSNCNFFIGMFNSKEYLERLKANKALMSKQFESLIEDDPKIIKLIKLSETKQCYSGLFIIYYIHRLYTRNRLSYSNLKNILLEIKNSKKRLTRKEFNVLLKSNNNHSNLVNQL